MMAPTAAAAGRRTETHLVFLGVQAVAAESAYERSDLVGFDVEWCLFFLLLVMMMGEVCAGSTRGRVALVVHERRVVRFVRSYKVSRWFVEGAERALREHRHDDDSSLGVFMSRGVAERDREKEQRVNKVSP